MSSLKILFVAMALVACSSCAPVEDSGDDTVQPDSEGAIRRRRAYSPWTGALEEYQKYESFSVWKPPVYQLSRPYYIPVYGVSGRIPVYFPPQPLHPFRGPPYLPPPKEEPMPAAPTEQTTTPDISNRMPDFEDRPVWGTVPTETDQSPSFPPLVHDIGKPSRPGMHLSVDSELDKAIGDIFSRPVQTPAKNLPPTKRPFTSPTTTRTTTRTTTTTARPATSTALPGPSNCVWAVISCCSANTEVVPESCFEQRGCPGPFWDASPCSSSYARAALDTVMKYYENAKRA